MFGAADIAALALDAWLLEAQDEKPVTARAKESAATRWIVFPSEMRIAGLLHEPGTWALVKLAKVRSTPALLTRVLSAKLCC